MKFKDHKDFNALLKETREFFERVKSANPSKARLIREGARTYTETTGTVRDLDASDGEPLSDQ